MAELQPSKDSDHLDTSNSKFNDVFLDLDKTVPGDGYHYVNLDNNVGVGDSGFFLFLFLIIILI